MLSLAILVALTGCEQIDKLTQFNVPVSKSVTIPAIPALALNIPVKQSFTVQTNIQSKFDEFNTSSDLVEQVFLQSLSLELTAPANGNLDFLKSIKVFISADGLPEKLIASKTGLTASVGTKLNLDVDPVDLKEYLLKDPITLAVEVEADQATSTESTITVSGTFKVDAKILGM